jgi:hypothetical protein
MDPVVPPGAITPHEPPAEPDSPAEAVAAEIMREEPEADTGQV